MNNNTRKKVRGLFLAAALLPLLAVQQVHASEGSVVRRINESTGQKARSLVPENIYGSGSRRSTEQKNGKSGQDVSDATGPGAGGAAEDTFQGPVVEDVRITETYHEDYRLYEEGLGEKAFFYSNIANGTWTDKPVRFEIPEQISVSASRDGAPYPFERGQAFAERGSYLLTCRFRRRSCLRGAFASGFRKSLRQLRPDPEIQGRRGSLQRLPAH